VVFTAAAFTVVGMDVEQESLTLATRP
jgi:hypothetical protein